jgi:rhomboid protease GluP
MTNAPVTRVILWGTVALYAAGAVLSRSALALVEQPERVLLAMGANYARATVGDHRYETLVTSTLLHFSILHLVFNLYALRQIGPPIERNVGSGRMAPMMLVAGVAGSALSAAVGWVSGEERVSAGVSGAICGIIGAALVLGLRAEGAKSRLAWAMGRWLAMLLVVQFIAQLVHVRAAFDNAAHFGGALVGGIFAATWRRGPPYGALARRVALGASALVVAAAFAVTGWRDLHDPFARMRATDRYEMAKRLLAAGDCRPAREAISATARLLPHAPEVLALEQELASSCQAR